MKAVDLVPLSLLLAETSLPKDGGHAQLDIMRPKLGSLAYCEKASNLSPRGV